MRCCRQAPRIFRDADGDDENERCVYTRGTGIECDLHVSEAIDQGCTVLRAVPLNDEQGVFQMK
jgi:hypothetical protein